LTPAAFLEKVIPQAMRNRGTVGSFSGSHRAKAKRPDRRNFLPQTGQLPSAAIFSEQLPQLRSIVPKSTGVKTADDADAYEHILTIQNAADLEFPATDPANAPARAEFKLGIFPPDHHVPPATPMPVPATTPPAK
jgi:hypothetical protein